MGVASSSKMAKLVELLLLVFEIVLTFRLEHVFSGKIFSLLQAKFVLCISFVGVTCEKWLCENFFSPRVGTGPSFIV